MLYSKKDYIAYRIGDYIEVFFFRFPFRSCVRGKLVELNEVVLANPQLLIEKPFGPGHLAVLHPHKQAEGIQELHGRLLSEDEYEQQRRT